MLKNKLFKIFYPWVPFVIFGLLVAASYTTSNFDRIWIQKTPEITGVNNDTMTNMPDGTWDFGDADIKTSGDIYLGAQSNGINFIGLDLTQDTIVSDAILFTSRSDHSIVLVAWADTLASPLDTTSFGLSTHVWAVGSCLVVTSAVVTVGIDTGFYGWSVNN